MRDWLNNAGTDYHANYDSYGKLLSTPAVDSVFGYTGSYRDPLTGLTWDRNRWYDPTTGTWISEDPIEFGAGDSNFLRYCNNSPANWIDPTGLEVRKQWPDQESKRQAIAEALSKEHDLRSFVERWDPTYGKEGGLLINLEYDTPCYGNVDVDWLLTILDVHYGNGPGLDGWILKGQDPGLIYSVGKTYWIIKDGIEDRRVGINFHRYGQPNEYAAVRAARDLLNGKTTLPQLFGVPCDNKSNNAPPAVEPPPPTSGSRRSRDRNRDRGREGRTR